MFDKPMGGTELMMTELARRLGESYSHLSIFNYVGQADFNKTTVFWNQLSYDQEAVQWMSDPKNIELVDQIVFVSHWQAERFRQLFGIPGFKTQVIKNACIGVPERVSGPRNQIKICYTSTPWRGLDILLKAWEILQPADCELHVFSSCKIYGPEFSNSAESQYQDLYDKCENLEGVVYRGSIPNADLRQELSDFDILAYPNTFEETSCISVIDALSSGLRVVTSNIGALPETTEGWARIYPYLMDPDKHAQTFSEILKEEIDLIRSGKLDAHLEAQQKIYQPRWSWDSRIPEWIKFLNTLDPKKL